MARFQLDDPKLQTALDELAERDAADWPAPDADAQAQLRRLLTPPPATTPAKPTRQRNDPQRRAA